MGGETSFSLVVPYIKSQAEQPTSSSRLPPPEEEAGGIDYGAEISCPICMQIITDAFLAACGHSFCHMCIITHLRNKNDCPCCACYLTPNLIFPNFLLDKILKRTSACQLAKRASPVERLHQALQQGCEISTKEIDELLYLLTEKKRKIEQEEAETNMMILLDFLCCLRKKKLEYLEEIQTEIQFIMEDIDTVEKRTMMLNGEKDIYSSKPKIFYDDLNSKSAIQSGLTLTRKEEVHEQFNELQEYYFQKRRYWARLANKQEEKDENVISREGFNPGLEDFESVLTTFTQHRQLRVIAELRHADIFHSANIVSSIEFDRDDELFAIAGVSRRIKIFEFFSVVNEPTDIHCPIVELPTRSKLSCLSWNKYSKNHIASSDYEGIVTVWDVNTHQSVMEYEEHERRAWSVDFSHTEPWMLVSGSDDCKVKIWCTKQETSVLSIAMKANICSVKYNPGSSIFVAVGSADHHIHYYDLRNISRALCVFKGHRKAVSYVNFLSNNELASASTDSTLRLWDVKDNMLQRTFRGHANEKNFVGLAVNNEYLACGSETNEVFVYHKAISKPAAWHRFSSDLDDADNDAGVHFVSSVCWKRDSPTMLTANSRGMIKILQVHKNAEVYSTLLSASASVLKYEMACCMFKISSTSIGVLSKL